MSILFILGDLSSACDITERVELVSFGAYIRAPCYLYFVYISKHILHVCTVFAINQHFCKINWVKVDFQDFLS